MLNPLHIFLRPPASTNPFSTEEILTILRGEDRTERARAVLDVVGATSSWLPPDPRPAFGSLAWYAERLPTIFHLYRRGWSPEQIGRRMSPLGGGWAIEQTLQTAAELIIDQLKKRPMAA